MIEPHDQPRANKTDAGNGSKAICRVSNVLRSPSPDPRRSATRHHTTVKTHRIILGLIIAATLVLSGCSPTSSKSDTVAEGVLFSVEYQMEGGRTGGFTRLNESKAVPGGNGSWNIDAYGRLTREFLVITRPQRSDLGPQVIPAHRLVSVQFGDGGIKQVNENQPKPGT